MDYETVFETCLIQFQPIRAKDLQQKLAERNISVSRSQFYRYVKRLEKTGKLERKNGIYSRPSQKSVEPARLGFFDWWERRAERKRREREQDALKFDRGIRELECRRDIDDFVMFNMTEKEREDYYANPELQTELEQRWRKRHRLS